MTQKRIRPPFLKVAATPEEAASIRHRASCARLPVAAYLRTLGLGCKVKSVAGHEAVIRLCNINADLGRLGGLLKLWLSEQPGRGAAVTDVRDLLHKIEATQDLMRDALRRI
jgi:hypothetical protein